MIKRYSWIGVILLGVGLSFGIQYKYEKDLEQATDRYRSESRAEAERVQLKYEDALGRIYEGLRTMARLPGVKAIDRYGKEFSADSKQAVQELYNALGTAVSMSEVYLVPADLEPDQIDKETGELQSPIITYDEIILGKKADDGAAEEEGADAGPALEETEIHEYRLMKEQIAWLKNRYAQESSINGLNYPVISGPDVITCDNSRFSASNPNDYDRSGLIFSVPFYSPEGMFKGLVSGVILNRALQDFLPSEDFVLVNEERGYIVTPTKDGPWKNSLEFIRDAKPNPGLIASDVIPVGIRDSNKSWYIWMGKDDSAFWARHDVQGAQTFRFWGLALVFVLCVGGVVVFFKQKSRDKAEKVIRLLSRTSDSVNREVGVLTGVATSLNRAGVRQASAVEEAAATVNEIDAMLTRTVQNAENSLATARAVSSKADAGLGIMSEMTRAMTSIRNSNTQLEKLTQIIESISSKTSIINDIVFKTQLLSFNASIEAARAGQHGRGFAVVAEEVGSLAELSGTAAREIDMLLGESAREVAGIITSLKEKVETGDEVSQEAVSTFTFVTQEISKVSEQIGEILACGQEQAKGVQQTVVAMSELNSLAQESRELSQKTNVAGSSLSKEIKNLGQVTSAVTHLFLGDDAKAAARAKAGGPARKPGAKAPKFAADSEPAVEDQVADAPEFEDRPGMH